MMAAHARLLVLALTLASLHLWQSGASGAAEEPADPAVDARERLARLGVPYTGDAFVASAARGDARVLGLFLSSGLSPDVKNRDGFTALMWSAGQGHLRLLESLLDRRADVNAASRDGTTALMSAASQGHAEAARRLIAHGAVVDARRADGWTALTWSAAQGRVESVRLLLASGAAIDVADARGVTPLIYAAANITEEAPTGSTLPVVTTLLSHGARLERRLRTGRPP